MHTSLSSRPARILVGGASALALGLSLTACGSASGSTDGGAARMAFANGFSGGGPVDEFIAGLNCYAEKNGLDTPVVTIADGDVNKQLNDIDSLIARANKIDGIFVIPVDPNALRSSYSRAQESGMAVIDPISPDADGKFATAASSHVAPDDLGVPQMVVDYLVAEQPGTKKVVILSPPPGQKMSDDRATNFRAAAEAAGLTVVGEINMDKLTTEEAQKKMEDFLTKNRDVQAVFAQNGAMGRGAALAGRSQGIDLVVTSLDSDSETMAAVKSGDIDAAFGADLFAVAYKASQQAETIKAGGQVEFESAPYQIYTQSSTAQSSPAARCDQY
ncbi:monosaccharide ABC transporter substrate-binding protein (CUT2 family) [Rhodococcus sp. OK519]|uniref:sugar ABC transporter substrate-binding protein n=1 Tax=Rhodococcus sp. OK519 TaxID=2135729 RepID=UPI000D3BBD2D|nr:monosaccharide ABC transporter substrate-binding protein (CUT2 family) [Rhodococcus sp. OK519]